MQTTREFCTQEGVLLPGYFLCAGNSWNLSKSPLKVDNSTVLFLIHCISSSPIFITEKQTNAASFWSLLIFCASGCCITFSFDMMKFTKTFVNVKSETFQKCTFFRTARLANLEYVLEHVSEKHATHVYIIHVQ